MSWLVSSRGVVLDVVLTALPSTLQTDRAGPFEEMLMAPAVGLTVIPAPAVALVTPVFESTTEPVAALALIPAPEVERFVTPVLVIVPVSVAEFAPSEIPVPAEMVSVSLVESATRLVPPKEHVLNVLGVETAPVDPFTLVTPVFVNVIVSVPVLPAMAMPVPVASVSVSFVLSATMDKGPGTTTVPNRLGVATAPAAPLTVSTPVLVTTTAPVLGDTVTPAPAEALVTPVLLIVRVSVVALPVRLIPVLELMFRVSVGESATRDVAPLTSTV